MTEYFSKFFPDFDQIMASMGWIFDPNEVRGRASAFPFGLLPQKIPTLYWPPHPNRRISLE